ncbi:two-component sensor histidine kinase [Filimonas lacunae]|nr:two-component sensor histidine kinase [Filimonas lacunae]
MAWQSSPSYPGALLADTAAINNSLQKAYAIREAHSDSSIQLCKQALASAEALHYEAGICEAYIGLSRAHFIVNRNDEALVYARKALPHCTDESKKYEQETNIYLAMAFVYYYQGRYDSCAWYRYKALNLVETQPTINTQVQLTAYSSVLQFWLTAHSDIKNDVYVQNIMARINQIEKKAVAAKDSSLLLEIYFRKSGYHSSCNNIDSMRYYSKKTIDLARRLHSTPSVITASLLNLAESYLDEDNAAAGLHYTQEAIKAIPDENKEQNRFYIYAMFDMADAWYLQKKYTQAIDLLESSIEKADTLGIFLITDYAHKILANCYEATGNYSKAAMHWKTYAQIRDSMVKEKKMELVYNVEMKYRIADKERELAQKELSIIRNENRIKIKNIWIGIILTATTLLLILGLLINRNNKHKHKLQGEKIRNLHQELAISSLQAMIAGEEKERSRIARDLHDGMGGMLAIIRTRLSSVYRKLDTTDSYIQNELAEIILLLEESSTELRKTAHNLMPEILLREGLMNATLLFCERIRKGYMLEINTEIWGDTRRLADDFELMVYRIIQELVHNTLKHARATQALVQIVYYAKTLSITVEDNGSGIHVNKPQHAEGTGLKNIRERVSSLNGQMDISSTPGKGTSVYIELEVQEVTA